MSGAAIPAGAAEPVDPAFAGYLARLADSSLVLGHRLSEWCGHGPVLEEDIALTNLALDCLGHASVLLRLVGQADGSGRDEDQLAYFREAVDYRNVLLVEQPNGDFARTMARVFLFSAWAHPLYGELAQSASPGLAAAAAKFRPELRYHLRHSARWMAILGDGTDESHARLQEAIDAWWPYTLELSMRWPGDDDLIARRLVPEPERVRAQWSATVAEVLGAAGITVPAAGVHMLSGGAIGRHSEALGYLLAEMQIVARSFPGGVVVSVARTAEDAWRVLGEVPDPELPVLSVVELGIVRSVVVEGGGVRVAITPTFTACPAMRVIERDVADRLRAEGFAPVTVETVLTPVWTTDWIGDEARRKLKAYGIAPPERGAQDGGAPWLDRARPVPCPRCDSPRTRLISAFGSTPCKALHRCDACQEPFEHFKCH